MLNKVKRTMHEKSKNFKKKRKYWKVLNRNHRAKEYNNWNKNSVEEFNKRWDQAEERIRKLKQGIGNHPIKETKEKKKEKE